MDCFKLFYIILCVIHLPYSSTLPNPLPSMNEDKNEKIPQRHVGPLPDMLENGNSLDPFEMEGEGGQSTTTQSPIEFDLEEAGLDRKLLGLPGWEYLTVGLVVVVATVIGGTVAIVCKKCGGLFGRGSEKDSD